MMRESTSDYYEFDGIRFYSAERRLFRFTDKAEFSIRPKQRDFLELLVQQPGQIVSYQKLHEILWPEAKDLKSLLPTIRETKSTLDTFLGEITRRRGEIIETVPKRGYRLNAEVRRFTADGRQITSSVASARPLISTTAPGPLRFGQFSWHVATSSFLYGALYGFAVPLELAYRFNQFRSLIWWVSPMVFCWIVVSSMASMYADWKITAKKKPFGLPILVFGLIVSGIIAYTALTLILPEYPITQASGFQTHTAEGAYLKNVMFYFLPLGVVFLALPYHFVVARAVGGHVDQPQTFHIKPKILGTILFAAAIVSLLLSYHLLNNLQPSPYRNLFTQLVIVRAGLIFGLGLECVMWYSRALHEVTARPV